MPDTSGLPEHAWRALHSFTLEAAVGQPDPEVAGAVVALVGTRLVEFHRNFRDGGRLQLATMLGTTTGYVHLRVQVLGDDGIWYMLTAPRGCDLGIDETAWAAVTQAECAAFGIEPTTEIYPLQDDEDGRGDLEV